MTPMLCPVVVGRDEELTQLEGAMDAALGGRGGAVALTGEPGIGKSRLLSELIDRAAARGAATLKGRAASSSSNPYRPLTEALLQAPALVDVLRDEGLGPWVPLLGALLSGMIDSDAVETDVSPAVRGQALLQLLRRLRPTGLVLALEDLHWADPDTVALVEYLVDNLADSPVLCAFTVRDEPTTPALDLARRMRGGHGLLHLPLQRLPEADVIVMVRHCAPDAEVEIVDRVGRAAEGVPLLIEDVLASPGLPASFTETVRERIAECTTDERAVIEGAAVIGRRFEWELLSDVTDLSSADVAHALEVGVQRQLLSTEDDAFCFRHALTREAVLADVLPPRHRALADAALRSLDRSHPQLDGAHRDLAADLATRAGHRVRAGQLLEISGCESLEHGALATAIETLSQALELLEASDAGTQASLRLIEALALAGRVDEAMALGAQVIGRCDQEPGSEATRLEVHLQLSQAAIAAARWTMARHQLTCARDALTDDSPASATCRLAVLEADVAFALDDVAEAQRLAETALSSSGATPDIACHALEIIGRSRRFTDLTGARSAFEEARITAESANIPFWRLRALHELGTIDLFDHAGTERLGEARRTAEQVGALSTAAILDLQLSAAYTCRWDLDSADAHARSALQFSLRLGLDQVRSKALAMLGGGASMRCDEDAMERYLSESAAVRVDDRNLDGFEWGSRGMVLLLRGELEEALKPFGRGMAIFSKLPHAEPAAMRAVWPVLLASLGDRRAGAAIEEAMQPGGVGSSNLNRALINYAQAIMAGRVGHLDQATEMVAIADRQFRNCDGWAELARVCAAPSALKEGWGDPMGWLKAGAVSFRARGLTQLADRCEALLANARPNPWSAQGVTQREADVLRLVVQGMANKEIGVTLQLSPRTVEKHVESLLRKTGARSRTELAIAATSKGPLRASP